jgi:carboxypeptidase-like protein
MPCPSQFTLCHEKWAEMTPTARGRLCAKCDRELIDFTAMSEDEISAYHLRNPGTCGLYSLSQFHKPASRLAAAAAAAAIGLTAPAIAHAAVPAPEPGPDVRQPQVEPADSIVVTGTVVDSATNQPIVGAQVFVKGTRLGAITDADGRFRFVVRSAMTFPLRLQAQVIGYTSSELLVTTADSLADMQFVLSQVFIGIRGLIVTGVPLTPTSEARPSFTGSSIRYGGPNSYGGYLTPFVRRLRRVLGGK